MATLPATFRAKIAKPRKSLDEQIADQEKVVRDLEAQLAEAKTREEVRYEQKSSAVREQEEAALDKVYTRFADKREKVERYLPCAPPRPRTPAQPGAPRRAGRSRKNLVVTEIKSCEDVCDLSMKGAIACGAKTEVLLPSGGGTPRSIPARYCLVWSGLVRPSHLPLKGFAPNPDYPEGVQERRYDRDDGEQLGVINIARNPKPEAVFSTAAQAIDGPPIVTPTGVALGGNKRTMGIQLHYANGGTVYSDFLRKRSLDFGIRPEDVDKIPPKAGVGFDLVGGGGPMIVRVVDLPLAEWKQAVRALNTSLTQSMDPLAEAVAIGHQIPEEVLQLLANNLAADDLDLSEYLRSERSRPLVAALQRAEIITTSNANRYLGPGRLVSDTLRELLVRALAAKVIPDANLLEQAGEAFRTALARSAPYWLAAAGYGGAWDVRGPMTRALRDWLSVHASGLKTLDRWKAQTSLFEPPATAGDPMAEQLLQILWEKRGPVQLSRVARRFATEAAQFGGPQTGLLKAPEPLEVLRSADAGPQPALFAV